MRASRINEEILRRGAADFFVGHEKQSDPRRLRQLPQPVEDAETDRYTGLHVEDPRAARDVAIDLKRNLRERAHRPNRVDVPKKESSRADGFDTDRSDHGVPAGRTGDTAG